ncbi:hypothetical protein [Desulfobulbus propionicus]
MEPRNPMFPLLIAVLLLSAPIPFSARATTIDMPSDRAGHRQGPPPEFVEACRGKQAGDTVIVETPRGESVEAVCEKHGDQLAARPINPPPQPPEQPPEK